MLYRYLVDHWLTLHGLIVMLGLAIYVTGSHTLHQRRNPSAAIAWVVSLVLMPYVALPLYLVFGSRKLKGSRPASGKVELPPELPTLKRSPQGHNNLQPSWGSRRLPPTIN